MCWPNWVHYTVTNIVEIDIASENYFKMSKNVNSASQSVGQISLKWTLTFTSWDIFLLSSTWTRMLVVEHFFWNVVSDAPVRTTCWDVKEAIARTWNYHYGLHMAFHETAPARRVQFHKENAYLTPYPIVELIKWPHNLLEHCKFIDGCSTNRVISKHLPIIMVFCLDYFF
jgi:hypothetical protein